MYAKSCVASHVTNWWQVHSVWYQLHVSPDMQHVSYTSIWDGKNGKIFHLCWVMSRLDTAKICCRYPDAIKSFVLEDQLEMTSNQLEMTSDQLEMTSDRSLSLKWSESGVRRMIRLPRTCNQQRMPLFGYIRIERSSGWSRSSAEMESYWRNIIHKLDFTWTSILNVLKKMDLVDVFS